MIKMQIRRNVMIRRSIEYPVFWWHRLSAIDIMNRYRARHLDGLAVAFVPAQCLFDIYLHTNPDFAPAVPRAPALALAATLTLGLVATIWRSVSVVSPPPF